LLRSGGGWQSLDESTARSILADFVAWRRICRPSRFAGAGRRASRSGASSPAGPDAQLSFGANQAWLSGRYRANLRDAGIAPKHAESAIELTYADQLLPGFTVQPDFQLIFDPAGERGRRSAKVVSLRLRYER
jgi:hypothetical protein